MENAAGSGFYTIGDLGKHEDFEPSLVRCLTLLVFYPATINTKGTKSMQE